MAIGVVGAILGLIVQAPTVRVAVCVVSGALALGTICISVVQGRRYRRFAVVSRGMGQGARADDTAIGELATHAMLERYEEAFNRVALVGFVMAVVGFSVGPLLSGPTQALTIAVAGGGGLLLAWMAKVIGHRVAVGPKMT